MECNKIRLGDIATIITKGTTPTSLGFEFEENGINFIKIESIKEDGTFIPEKFAYISNECNEKLKRSQLQKNDVLFSIAGAIGKTAIVTEDVLPANTNQALAIIRIPEGIIDYRFLLYALQSDEIIEQSNKKKQGVAQLNLSLQNINDFEIPCLSINQQFEIVAALSRIDTLIAQRNEQLSKLDELIKSQFIEMFGNPVKNDMEWESKTLNDVCDGIGDGLHGTPEYDDDGDYPFINGNNLIDGEIVITPATKMVSKETYTKHLIDISSNAILISINGTLGKLAFYNGERVMLGKSACYCNLKPNINKVFVYGVMKSDAFAEFLDNSSTKSTIKNVGLKAMREYKLILPPTELQEQFATFVEQTDKSKLAIQQSLEKLETMKKALMQQYFG